MNMIKGQVVGVETFDGELIQARFVEATNTIANVCSDQEWEAARAERRQPECLGWPIRYVQEWDANKSRATV